MNQDNPYQPPATTTVPKSKRSGTRTAEILAVIVIVAILIALLQPATMSTPRGGNARAKCKNNLKQIVMALHNYHDAYGIFPPAAVYDQQGRAAHSWRVLILPYLEEQELYESYSFDEPWNGPNNSKLHSSMPRIYRCPSFYKQEAPSTPLGQQLSRLTNYVLVVSPDGAFHGDHSPTIKSFADGTDHTIMTAEVRQHAVHWMAPDDVTPSQLLTDLRLSVDNEHSNHAQGLHIGLADGSVRWIPHDTIESDLHGLITIDGSEPAPADF